MPPEHAVLLFVVAFVAGLANALAGGGSFLTFPLLVYVGVPSIAANATSTIALLPGSITSAFIGRRDLHAIAGVSLPVLTGVGVVGGAAGAILLLSTPQASFDHVVPWLLLVATTVFALGNRLHELLPQRAAQSRAAVIICQLVLGLYGGYFGGAVGIMTIAAWTLFGASDVRALNATKNFTVAAMNAMAVVCFVFARAISWRPALLMAVAAVAGGYTGARIGLRARPAVLRGAIIVVSMVVTAAFFVRMLRRS